MGLGQRDSVVPFPQARRRAEFSGALDWDGVLDPAFLVVAADASWSVKDGVGTAGIDVDLDPRPDEMGTHRAPGSCSFKVR